VLQEGLGQWPGPQNTKYLKGLRGDPNPFPSDRGCHSPGRPWGSQAWLPLWALPSTPHPPPPNPWVQCLLSHSDASNEGASWGPQCGRALGRVSVLSAALPHLGVRGAPRAGGSPNSAITGCLTVCMWHFLLLISFTRSPQPTPLHPARGPTPEARAYLFLE
jgi:hypothetical protein